MEASTLLNSIKDIASKKRVYHFFENNSFFTGASELPVGKTIWQGKTSPNSLSFQISKKGSELAQLFGIESPLFYSKFDEATHGSGNELNKIGILNSSSLAALLFFHNVSPDNKLIIDINEKKAEFDECHFEAKNKCIGSPSNVDIALFGTRADKKIVLFLEAKFSEYLTLGTCYNISTAYSTLYKKEYKKVLEACDLTVQSGTKKENNGSTKNVINLFGSHYCEGIKQMICHHIGVNNFYKNDYHKGGIQNKLASYLGCKTKELSNKEYDIYLGEIVFKFDKSVDEGHKAFKDYEDMYSKFVNNVPESPVKLVNQLLTYQTVFKDYNGLTDKIKAYYKM